jgi:hypothetical protein
MSDKDVPQWCREAAHNIVPLVGEGAMSEKEWQEDYAKFKKMGFWKSLYYWFWVFPNKYTTGPL